MKETELGYGFPTEVVREGETSVVVPKLEAFVEKSWEYAPSKAPVFYNPVMELNRDLAVLALQAYQKMVKRKLSVCEPLTGCGVRGIRLAVEVEDVNKIVLNDINDEAARLAGLNVQRNHLCNSVSIRNEDANLLLSRHAAPRRRFNYIDIDPFGSPTPYLDSAVRALRNGGLIALTATDMAPLCGVHPRACVRKYGGRPLRTEYCRELAVRLLSGALAMTAARHEIGVKVLFSHSTDHYVRVYALAHYGAKRADSSVQKMGYVLHCFTCLHREPSKVMFSPIKRKCPECGSQISVAGPLWLGKIFNEEFCSSTKKELMERNLKNQQTIRKLLSLSIKEAEASPTYYVTDKIGDKLDLPLPPLTEVINELRKIGFQATRTHFSSRGVRTDAPSKVMKQVLSTLVA